MSFPIYLGDDFIVYTVNFYTMIGERRRNLMSYSSCASDSARRPDTLISVSHITGQRLDRGMQSSSNIEPGTKILGQFCQISHFSKVFCFYCLLVT